LLEDLAPTRDLAHSPVFQVMFVLQSKAFVPASLGQARCSPIVVDTGIAHFDLTLFVHETDEGFTGALEYASDLFEPSTITRLAGHLLTLLHAIVEDPRAPISALPLMTPEARRALAAFNATARPYPREASIPSLVARWAEERPEAVALRLGDEALSRGELQRRARALAHRLVHAGVAPGSVVALLLPRSFASIVAMLAVLEAGGAYLALDPTLPPARLAFLLHDAGVRLALTTGRSRAPSCRMASRSTASSNSTSP
jgi:non-ribosomal peptide synthetase component F